MNILNFFINRKNKEDKNVTAINNALQAHILFTQNKNKQALKYINKSISHNPNNDKFLYQRTLIYIRMKQYLKALTDINKAINLNSTIYYYYLIRADVYYFLNNSDEELKNIQYAKELMPNAYRYFNMKFDLENKRENQILANHFYNRMQRVQQI